MIDERTNLDLKEIPELEEPQVYIYVMKNSVGKIKIGKTKNIYKRYLSLSGSNSQGNDITNVYCSPATYLYSMEWMMHDHFKDFRIKGTEWFEGVSYKEIVDFLNTNLESENYKTCNELRRKWYES